MANGVSPSGVDNQPYDCKEAHAILDELILYGNRVAGARKRELSRIETLFQEFTRQLEQQGLRHLNLSSPVISQPAPSTNPIQLEESDLADPGMTAVSNLEGPLLSDDSRSSAYTGDSDNFGISSYEFLSIVDQLTNPVPHGLFDMRPEWLSGDALSFTEPFT
jgi:hypothetical protein